MTFAVTPFDNSALAQEVLGGEETADREIEEIIVTARFRKERVQDIGASIAAYDESRINREMLFDVQDIALRTVGMEVLDCFYTNLLNRMPPGKWCLPLIHLPF